MEKKIIFFVAATLMSVNVSAATPKAEQGNVTWSVSTGLGYDSNVYRAPRAPYVDYAALPLGLNPPIVPQKKTGFFVPFEIKVETAKRSNLDTRLTGSATASGSFYTQAELKNANDYNVHVQAGPEFVLAREGKAEDTFFIGALIGKHKQVYVDHDTGLAKLTSVSRTDISNRYSYTSMGLESKYKHRTGKIDFGFTGQYVNYDYEDPLVVSQQDHSYYKLGTDVSIPIASKTKLGLSYDYSVQDYSDRHARNTQGKSIKANPLLLLKHNVFGVKLRNQISPEWLLYLDFDHTRSADAFVGYDDSRENKFGARLLYEQGRIKTRLSVHHWNRDYPNGFAFDVAGQAAKTYSGNDLKFKAELEQGKNTALWTELAYKNQHTTDLRYDFVGSQIMLGMSWAY